MTTEPSTLTDRIHSRIKNQTPLPKLYFNIVFCLSIFAAILMLAITVFSLTFFAWDFMRLIRDISPRPGTLIRLLTVSLFEFFAIGLFSSFVTVKILRAFDTSLNKNIGLVVGLVVATTLGLVGGFLIVTARSPLIARCLERLDNNTQLLPYRKNRHLFPRRNLPEAPIKNNHAGLRIID
jgi:hypothetical protein